MNIVRDSSCNSLCYMDEITLRNVLNKIKSVLGSDFPDNVKWILFDADAKFRSSMSSFEKVFYPRKGKEYGFYDTCKKEIWVSTLAVRRYNNRQLLRTNATLLQQVQPEHPNLLIDVIIDEITHAITGKNHDSIIYNQKYKELIFRCIKLW